MHRDPIVQLRNVSCGYDGKTVLSGLDLEIPNGSFIGILGPSGSGKTTLLRCILGEIRLYEGETLVNGVSTKSKRPRVGYVPQLETIDWNFPITVEETVLMGRTMDNVFLPWYKRTDRELAYTMMEKLGIAHLAKRQIRKLSGGQQQRVFLARALVSSPHLLLLDEPTAGVDIKTRDDIMHLLHDLNHQDITIILTTHEINSIAAHLPWVVCLSGRIITQGAPSEVFTTETFWKTYKAKMPVIEYEGMKLVAEQPHSFYQNRQADPDTSSGKS